MSELRIKSTPKSNVSVYNEVNTLVTLQTHENPFPELNVEFVFFVKKQQHSFRVNSYTAVVLMYSYDIARSDSSCLWPISF